MRLIDADELITILDEELQEDSSLPRVLLVGFAKQILNDAPTVDAEPIVRCKDCKYNTLGGEKGNSLCELEMPLFQNDDFCSRGERI